MLHRKALLVTWVKLVDLITTPKEPEKRKRGHPKLYEDQLFFALPQIALTGTALPLVRYLNQRFGRQRGLFVEPGLVLPR